MAPFLQQGNPATPSHRLSIRLRELGEDVDALLEGVGAGEDDEEEELQ
jgi:hypothetical protein